MIVSRYLNVLEGNLAGHSKIIFDSLEQFSFSFLYMELATLAEWDCLTVIDSTSQQKPAELGKIGDGVLLAVASHICMENVLLLCPISCQRQVMLQKI